MIFYSDDVITIEDAAENSYDQDERERIARIETKAPIPPKLHAVGNCPNCNLCIVEQDERNSETLGLIYTCPRCGNEATTQELIRR